MTSQWILLVRSLDGIHQTLSSRQNLYCLLRHHFITYSWWSRVVENVSHYSHEFCILLFLIHMYEETCFFKGALSPGFLLFLVQFCQNYCLLPVIVQKNAPTESTRWIPMKFYSRASYHNNFVGDFLMHRVNFWKNWQVFSNFNPFPSSSSLMAYRSL